MSKRQRLENTLAGGTADRVPVALWRRWPGDDQRAADLARSVLDFQQVFDWDLVRVVPASSYQVADFGLRSTWEGAACGDRTMTAPIVQRSLAWTELRAPHPERGEHGKQLAALSLITGGLPDDAPVILTVYSPLAQAAMLAGQEGLLHHLRTAPDRLRSGLNTLTETVLRFIDILKRLDIAGIAYVVQQADYTVLSEQEYLDFGYPYDRKVLESLPTRWWLNMIEIGGAAPMFHLVANLPTAVIQWNCTQGQPDLAQAQQRFSGVMCSGLDAERHLHYGTPATIRDAARDALSSAQGHPLILSTGQTVAVTTPLSNLRAVREVVEATGVY